MNQTHSLQGKLILDCSTLLPGPYVGKLLLEQGARVLKIENPDRPDLAREMGSHYEYLNHGKELVWLNLTKTDHQLEFKKLVQQADGLIEGFRPQAKIKLGLTEEVLHAINPKLCIASLVGYDENGPWKERAGHDLNFQAISGVLSLFNEAPALPLADLFASYEAAFKMACALVGVGATNRGQRAVTGMQGALLNMQGLFIHEYKTSGNFPHFGKTLVTGKHPCYRIYTTQDHKRVAVGAIEAKFWKKVCDILELPGYADFGMSEGPKAQEVIQSVQHTFSSKPWSYWEPLFERADCCVERVRDYSELE